MQTLPRQLGDYRLLELIGFGGMGHVYRAEHVHLGAEYAVKVLREDLGGDAAFRSRFRLEARVMATLRHPHIVLVHHMSLDGDTCFLVMEYITGPEGRPMSLHQVLAAGPQGRLHPKQAAQHAAEVASALACAHGYEVVHRDLKPANVLVDAAGRVRLSDFGLARAAGSDFLLSQVHATRSATLSAQATHVLAGGVAETERSLGAAATLPGRPAALGPQPGSQPPPGAGSSPVPGASGLLGTYDYMAPEQRDGGPVTPATDVYAFGVLLYRMLTGRVPRGLARPPSQVVRGLSWGWDELVERCMADEPGDRPADGRALLASLIELGLWYDNNHADSWPWSTRTGPSPQRTSSPPPPPSAVSAGGAGAFPHATDEAAGPVPVEAGRIEQQRAGRRRPMEGDFVAGVGAVLSLVVLVFAFIHGSAAGYIAGILILLAFGLLGCWVDREPEKGKEGEPAPSPEESGSPRSGRGVPWLAKSGLGIFLIHWWTNHQ